MSAVKAEASSGGGGAALEPYHRLVELQKQIIELVEQNKATERQCALLRERLECEADALLWSRRASSIRLRTALAAALGRLLRRAAAGGRSKADAPPPFKPDAKNWACGLFGAQSSQE